MDWSLLHALNDFLFRHDAVEDPLLFYVNASEALFVATLALVFLAARGSRFADWRRAVVAAVLSAGLGLAVAKVISELVDRARPFVADPGGVHYPSDVLAGAAVGSAAALALWAPPLRTRVDRLADWTGGRWDRTVERGASLLPGRQ